MLMKTRAELDAELISRVADDDAFRVRLLENPKEAIRQAAGIDIPEDFNVQVHEENSMTVHLVLPPSDQLTEAELEAVAGGSGGLISGWAKA